MSLLRSSEKRPAAAGPRRKAPADRYTVFLIIALVAIIIGIVFLYLELSLYEFKLDAPTALHSPLPSGQMSAVGDALPPRAWFLTGYTQDA